MKNRKNLILLAVVFYIGFLILGKGCTTKGNQIKEDGAITRYEWIAMLTERFGITEYINEEPYYKDVLNNNTYFKSIQSAVEWEILDNEPEFKGEEPATGEFIALTSIRAIGKYKFQIYRGKTDEISDKEYLKLAVKEDLIKRNQMKKIISKDESTIMLSKAMELYQYKLWEDDVSEINYQQEVVQIEHDNVAKINEEFTQIELRDTNSALEVGTVVIIECPDTKEKIAKRIQEISNTNVYVLEDVDLQEVIDTVIISDITSISAKDILSYYEELSKNGEVEKRKADVKNYKAIPVEYRKWESDGVTIQLESESGEITASIIDGGLAYEIPYAKGKIQKGTVSATINIENLCVGTQIVASGEKGIEYFNLQTQADISVEGELSLENSKGLEIPILKKPIRLAGGTVSTNLEFFLIVSIDGSLKVETRIPTSCSLDYSKEHGIRSPRLYIGMEEPQIVADSSILLSLRGQTIFKLLGIQLIDVEADCGIKGIGSATSRTSQDIFQCADLSIIAPVVSISISGDDEKSTLISGLGISAEWEIFNEDNAWHKGGHFEFYKDGEIKKVNECTFKQKISTEPPHYYIAYFKERFNDKGEYYEVHGKLVDEVSIEYSKLLELSIGDIYEYDGVNFIYEGSKEFELYVEHYFIDEYGKKYYTIEHNSYSEYKDNGAFVSMGFMVDDMVIIDGINYQPTVSVVVDEDFIFKIYKNARTSVRVTEESARETTIEDVFSNKIEDYEGICIGENKNIAIHVCFDGLNNVYMMSTEKYRDERCIVYLKPNN